jgi:circadian clock protein KaiC
VTALINTLRTLDVTTLVTEETQKLFGPEVEVRVEGMSALVENILFLEYLDVGPELRRLLSIIKQRASGYETTVRELTITERGIVLAASSASASKILAHASSGLKARRDRQSGPRVRKSRTRRTREK